MTLFQKCFTKVISISGFGIREYKDRYQVEQLSSTLDLHEVMIALTLFSKISDEKKIELIFDLTDSDEDGCLSSFEILKMIEAIERVAPKENLIKSRVLLEKLSRDKALRRYGWVMEILKANGKTLKSLITFEQFLEALKDVPNLKSQFLPKISDLKQYFQAEISEVELKIEESYLEDFLVFRYEMQGLLSDVRSPYNNNEKNLKSEASQKILKESSEYKNEKNLKKIEIEEYWEPNQPQIVNQLLKKESQNTKLQNSSKNQTWRKECPGLINGGKSQKNLLFPDEIWEFNPNAEKIFKKLPSLEKGLFKYKKINREHVHEFIPPRPVQLALIDIKKVHESNENYKNDDVEITGYDDLIHKINAHVADTKKKHVELEEIKSITRKMDLKKMNDRGIKY